MTLRVTMLSATGTDAGDELFFGDGGAGTATEVVLPPYALALRAPSARCARAAEALAIAAAPESALRDLDRGSWDGRPREDVAAEDPHGFSAWLTDPGAAPHGGESVAALCRRTAAWLDSLPTDIGRVLAVTEAAVVRAALVHGLSAPDRAFWHLGTPPPAAITLTLHDGCWTVRPGTMAIPGQRRQAADTGAAGLFAPLLVQP
ncbi:histidine phosphatase family protein [Streptomyces sp. NPDC089424]|uniref:histidine phosphatase family protein n=1 Tax=Streptomyces sp. NPDC089424 TaxID=3365917 RepID=UPI00380F3155